MTIAEKIVNVVTDTDIIAVSLYACVANLRSGATITLPRGVQEFEKRNDNGRVTMARYHYADDSRVHYTWSLMRGCSFTHSR